MSYWSKIKEFFAMAWDGGFDDAVPPIENRREWQYIKGWTKAEENYSSAPMKSLPEYDRACTWWAKYGNQL